MTLTREEQKAVRRLHQGKGRREQEKFLAEGVRLVEWAALHGVPPQLLVCAADLSERGQKVAEHYRVRGVRVETVPGPALEWMADSHSPSGLLAVFDLPSTTLKSWRGERRPGRLLILDGVSDPGNVGTLVRSAAAFHWPAVLAVGDCADPFGPKAVRASAGALFGMQVVRATPERAVEYLRREPFRIVAAAAKGSTDLSLLTVADRPPALVIGSEAEGVSRSLRALAEATVSIPQSERVESLNAAIAGSLLLWAVDQGPARRS